MESKSVLPYNVVFSLSLIIAPLLFGASTFFWTDGEYGVTGGTILALATVFWIMVFITLFDKLKSEMPLYSSIGLVLAIYGSISGNNFGMVGVFSEAFGITHDTYLKAASEYPLGFNLLLFWAGPLFPLSLLVLGVNLMRKKIVPPWVGIMIGMGAIAFPISRIPRIEMIAHAADLLIAIPFVYVGLKEIKS